MSSEQCRRLWKWVERQVKWLPLRARLTWRVTGNIICDFMCFVYILPVLALAVFAAGVLWPFSQVAVVIVFSVIAISFMVVIDRSNSGTDLSVSYHLEEYVQASQELEKRMNQPAAATENKGFPSEAAISLVRLTAPGEETIARGVSLTGSTEQIE